MPTYTRHCAKCDEIFDVLCRIADRDTLTHECPYCGDNAGVWMLSAPTLSRHSERLMTHRPDRGFGEVLSKIQERNKRTSISER